uniref:PilT protein domain-containing protein n=1 Tax=uncultured bacterium Contig19 TaxID=1393523 RepID=W0FH17_9BACT|nr:PilT protein domain-containing protein [uncultured bacterium Contig19]
MYKIALDTNILVDYLMGREPTCSDCKQLLLMHASCQHAVYAASISLKDAYYLVAMQLKRMERQASGALSATMARAANEVAWACIRSLIENVLVLPVGRAESIQAFTYKPLHNDFEDNLVVAAALSANVDFLVTNDEALLRHAPIACLSSNDMLALLKEERA